MQKIYSTAKICDFKQPNKCDLSLEPEITEIIVNSHDPEELKHLWTKWRDATGKKLKTDFIRYVELSNEIARLNNFEDMAAYWLKDYEAEDFVQQIGKKKKKKQLPFHFVEQKKNYKVFPWKKNAT